MKKFSKLILETKKELWTKHPLVNSEDWNQIFNPLIEHILTNRTDDPMTGNGVFSSKTKGALDELIDSIAEDYVQYYQDMVDDGSQESFFAAYNISVKWQDLMDCLQPLMDRTDDIDDYPSWNGGYWYMNLVNLKFEETDELIEDILDISGKLKMFKIDYKIQIQNSEKIDFSLDKTTPEGKIFQGITNLLELPSQSPKEWFKGLRGISIYIYNKATVQVDDLD